MAPSSMRALSRTSPTVLAALAAVTALVSGACGGSEPSAMEPGAGSPALPAAGAAGASGAGDAGATGGSASSAGSSATSTAGAGVAGSSTPSAGSGAAGASGSQAGSGGSAAQAGTGAPPDPGTPSEILVPAQGALLGMFYGADSVAQTADKLGRTPPVHLTYYAWDDDWAGSSITRADLDAGRIPLVNWEPYDPSLADIIAGDYDELIHARAAGAKALGERFFLDWGAEMNGDWSPWSGAENGMGPDVYLAAYRHIHDLFVADGATNVIWLWCPNVTDEPRSAWNETLGYYPGDEYVDWACVDGYNWGGSGGGGGWQTFHDVFADVYATLATTGKPIMIGEMASAEVGGDKAAWIDAMIPTLRDDFPMIRGLVWFDIDKETDWRISSSSAAEAAFVRLANDPYFNP